MPLRGRRTPLGGPLLPAELRAPVGLPVSEPVTNAVAADAAVGAVGDIEAGRSDRGGRSAPTPGIGLRTGSVLPDSQVASDATEGGVTAMQENGDRGDRRDQMVLRLVEAAGVVIDRAGYAGATTPEILRQAGVSRGGLYHHFEGKEQLGDAILDRQHEFFQKVSEQAASGPAPKVWLQALIDVSHLYTAGILEDPVLRAAVRLSIEPGPYQTAESYAGPLGAVTAVLESARAADELQDHVTPEEASRTLVGCYSGVQLLALALDERDALHQQVSAMWALIMPGLARPAVLTRLRLSAPPADTARPW